MAQITIGAVKLYGRDGTIGIDRHRLEEKHQKQTGQSGHRRRWRTLENMRPFMMTAICPNISRGRRSVMLFICASLVHVGGERRVRLGGAQKSLGAQESRKARRVEEDKGIRARRLIREGGGACRLHTLSIAWS